MTRIGWIGLGNMGAPMAKNAAAAGFDLAAYDLSPDARNDAHVPTVDSPVEALRDADIVVTMLPKGEHVRAALIDSGALNSAQPDALVIDCSTIAVDDVTALAEAVTAQGRRYIDAPVSGGTAGAEAGTLTFMVGGEATGFETAQPLLEAMGSRSFHVGDLVLERTDVHAIRVSFTRDDAQAGRHGGCTSHSAELSGSWAGELRWRATASSSSDFHRRRPAPYVAQGLVT